MLTVTPYKSQTELTRAHPEIKSLKLVHHAPRGQCTEAQIKALKTKKIEGAVYQVGDFFWQDAGRDPYENRTLCACLKFIGDNPDCAKHGGQK